MPLVATTLVPAPIKLVGPTVVRIDHPSQVDYLVQSGSIGRYADAPARKAFPPIKAGPALPEALPVQQYLHYVEDRPTTVTVVDICNWIDYKYGSGYQSHPAYEVISKALMSWCSYHKAHYYAAPRESFSVYAAMEEARTLGLGVVVVEDLS